MSNILRAFINIIENYQTEIETITQGNNRANNMGEGLEDYIKNSFLNPKDINNLEALVKVYSYQGNKNNPPDLMLKNGDAIEIKKLESKNSAIALYIKQNSLKSLWLVYGDCFCADKEIYERIKNTISNGINSISDVEFTETKELGKVKKVDPLGITDLRIRGMWHIDNPNKTFDYLYQYDESKQFQLICLMTLEKYKSLPFEDREMINKIENSSVEVKELQGKVKD